MCLGKIPGTLTPFNISLGISQKSSQNLRNLLKTSMKVNAGPPPLTTFVNCNANDCSMIHWICNVHIEDQTKSASLLEKLGINELSSALRYNRLRWFGHVCCNYGAIICARKLEVATIKIKEKTCCFFLCVLHDVFLF